MSALLQQIAETATISELRDLMRRCETGEQFAAIALRETQLIDTEMLAALKDCQPLFDLIACGEVQERVAAAIAKAEGR